MAWVGCGHHVACVKHLLGKLGDRQRAVLLRATRRQRREAHQEEVETRERDHVDGELAQIRVQLTREAQAGGNAGHDH